MVGWTSSAWNRSLRSSARTYWGISWPMKWGICYCRSSLIRRPESCAHGGVAPIWNSLNRAGCDSRLTRQSRFDRRYLNWRKMEAGLRLDNPRHSRRTWRRTLKRVGIRTRIGESATNESSAPTDDDAHRRGVGATSCRVRPLRLARAAQQRDQAVVPFVTPRLIVDAVLGVALLLQLLSGRPRSDPRRRIVDRDDIVDRVRIDARPPLDQMQMFVSALEIRLRRKVCNVDDQRVAF